MIVFPFVDARSSSKLELVHWRAWEVQVPDYDAPSWHLVGVLTHENFAKVSSALAQVNRAGNEAKSKTGSVYSLTGAPGSDANASRLWQSWQKQHRVAVLREVTAEVLAGRQPATVHLIRKPDTAKAEEQTAASLRGQRKW